MKTAFPPELGVPQGPQFCQISQELSKIQFLRKSTKLVFLNLFRRYIEETVFSMSLSLDKRRYIFLNISLRKVHIQT